MQQTSILPLIEHTRHNYAVPFEIDHAWTAGPWCGHVVSNGYMRRETFVWTVELSRVLVLAVADLVPVHDHTTCEMQSHEQKCPSTNGDVGRHAHLYGERAMATIVASGDDIGGVLVRNWKAGTRRTAVHGANKSPDIKPLV
jgi:hypothetical protein